MIPETWVQAGRALGVEGRTLNWRIAEWVLEGEGYGEEHAQYLDGAGLSPQTLLHLLAMARAFPPARRRLHLSFGHHEALMRHPEAEQERWLDLAEVGTGGLPWSATRLRREMRSVPTPRRQG